MAGIRPSGGYRQLRSFQIATIIYDATYWFCERFLEPRSRISDQMVQAARSGRRNIVEGSRAAATSSQTELRLVTVARARMEELVLDFEDYLRHRRLGLWALDSPESLAVRRVGADGKSDSPVQPDPKGYALYTDWLESADPAVRANALICLINEASYLLDRQIEGLEKGFISEGRYSEQPATARVAERIKKKGASDRPDPAKVRQSVRTCGKCGKPMALRTAQKGKRAGSQFWGCTGYPECKAVIEI